MKPNALTLAAATFLAAPAAGALEVAFDQNASASSVLKAAQSELRSAYHEPFGHRHFSIDCQDFVFKPDSPTVSERVTLRSVEWIEHCSGGGGPWPHDGWNGRHPRHCTTFPGHTYTQQVQVSLRERKPLLPWESDTFRVCLEGPWIRSNPVATGYEYARDPNTSREIISYIPGRKIPMRPDPAGLSVASLSPNLVLKLEDKWAQHYAGEKVMIDFYLVREWGILRPTIWERTLVLPTSEVQEIDLMAYKDEFKFQPQPGYKIHVNFNFRRVGTVSTDEMVPVRGGYLGSIRSPTVEYQPAPAGGSSR